MKATRTKSEDNIGRRIGSTVIEGIRRDGKRTLMLCKCDCGAQCERFLWNIKDDGKCDSCRDYNSNFNAKQNSEKYSREKYRKNGWAISVTGGAGGGTTGQAIVYFLARTAMPSTIKEIASGIEADYHAVCKLMQRLHLSGLVHRVVVDGLSFYGLKKKRPVRIASVTSDVDP